jgi:tetratricopeptide (TPR) repeat protein/O-antigen ligase
MAVGLLGLGAFAAGLAWRGLTPRLGIAWILPLVFLIVPFLQSLPMTFGLRSFFDQNGTVLLRDNQLVATAAWPLSLDPPNTRVDIGRAALALMVFLLAYHLASGQSRRHLLSRALGIAGVVAVVIGLGHRVLGFSKLFGVFNASPRSLLIGPFVNSNHTAEFLELTAFVCLACSFQRKTALNRIGWTVGTLLCAGGAAATLSRGAVAAFAMAAVMFVFLRYLIPERGSAGKRRVSLAWGALFLALILLTAGALGAGQLVDRFRAEAVSSDIRFQLWREALRVFVAHPFGIGRGAFDRVFPIYRSLKMAFPLRFAFVENEPLQLLIEGGWFFFLLMALAVALVIWQIARRGRRDWIEAALLAGLFAVLVHSTVDFGLETLGVLLPFAAVLGTVLGRQGEAEDRGNRASVWSRSKWTPTAIAALGLAVGIASAADRSFDDFDALLKKTIGAGPRLALLARAEQTHPLDYFYALSDARLEPLRGAPGSPSPRLHALNRALRLCPSCEVVHTDVARNLWSLGLHRQSILEWRTAIDIQPLLFSPTLAELSAAGAKPAELAAIAAPSPSRMTELASYLSAFGRISDAFVVLDQADALGAPKVESLLMRARLQLQAGQLKAATATLDAPLVARTNDPRLPVLQAEVLLADQGAPAADRALALLDAAAQRYPTNLGIQRARVDLVTRFEKWNAAARSLDGLKLALYQASGAATEAHVASARIDGRLGRWPAAIDEYRIALTADPNDVSLWTEYARAAERIGRYAVAREAYVQAVRLAPNNFEIAGALRELDARQIQMRSLIRDPGGRAPGE